MTRISQGSCLNGWEGEAQPESAANDAAIIVAFLARIVLRMIPGNKKSGHYPVKDNDRLGFPGVWRNLHHDFQNIIVFDFLLKVNHKERYPKPGPSLPVHKVLLKVQTTESDRLFSRGDSPIQRTVSVSWSTAPK